MQDLTMLVSIVLAVVAGLLMIPVCVFVVEIMAAITLGRKRRVHPKDAIRRGRVAVLVPAHNESEGLLPTLRDIQTKLRPADRLLVVADNCTDDTATVASAAGAEVVERHDPKNRGKGYALDFGLRHLAADPPDIVIVVDADCRLDGDALDRLATACATTRRPVQALYLMTAPEGASINYQVAEFAWRVKTWLRPMGLAALGLPCQLAGTGMAFPWEAIRSVDLASGSVVEDLKLGLDLATAGHPPLFCPSARVTSRFASSAAGAAAQRKRWEQGHIYMIVQLIPHLLRRAVACRNKDLLALAFDVAVPPLSLLALLVTGMAALASLAALAGLPSAALPVSAVSLVAFSLAVLLAWLQCGREVLPLQAVWSIGPYMLIKLGLYRRIVSDAGQDAEWIRTDRTKSG
jgi:cellulose synthase/poly-beta-1,6-N-acetylglucosamine synthase-like glycosyltransferase